MSLNFDFTAMIDRLGQEEYDRITDSPFEEGKWHPVTDALIWMTMSVGLPGITEKTVDKFVERALALQALSGGDLQSNDGRIVITEEDIRNHLGMRMNVGTESDATFKTKLFRMAIKEGELLDRKQKVSAHAKCAERAEKIKETADA